MPDTVSPTPVRIEPFDIAKGDEAHRFRDDVEESPKNVITKLANFIKNVQDDADVSTSVLSFMEEERSIIIPACNFQPGKTTDTWIASNSSIGHYEAADSTLRYASVMIPKEFRTFIVTDLFAVTRMFYEGQQIVFRLRSIDMENPAVFVTPTTDVWWGAYAGTVDTDVSYHAMTDLPLTLVANKSYYLEIRFMNDGHMIGPGLIRAGIVGYPSTL